MLERGHGEQRFHVAPFTVGAHDDTGALYDRVLYVAHNVRAQRHPVLHEVPKGALCPQRDELGERGITRRFLGKQRE